MGSADNSLGLKTLAIRGGLWTMGGFAVGQALKLLGSVVLSRFLAPEYYGLISIVTVFLIGLNMFSDIGIRHNIIQSDRGFDSKFLNTLWTIQVARGYFIWFVCLVAAYPMSVFYREPQLLFIIPVSGLTAIVTGYESTGIHTTDKRLDLKKQTYLEIVTQILTILIILAFALVRPSVWALVVGSLFSNIFRTIFSHSLDKRTINRFHWDAEVARSIMHFGGWIFVSTVLGYFVNSGSGLILAKFLTVKEFGLFSLGVTLSKVVEQVFSQVSNKVIFPIYVKFRDLPHQEVRSKILKIRLAVMVIFLPPLWMMAIFPDHIISFLFDSRYFGTAWVMQIFAVSYIPTIVTGVGMFYVANGDTYRLARVTSIKTAVYFACIFVGWWISSGKGIIYGMALNPFFNYLIDIFAQRRYKVWIPLLDLAAYGACAIVMGLAFLLF